MTLVSYYCAATLDGYIAESDDTLDWLLKYEGHYEGADSDAEQGGYESFYEGVGALVSGSTTYEWVLEHGSPARGSAGPMPASPAGYSARVSCRSPMARGWTSASSRDRFRI